MVKGYDPTTTDPSKLVLEYLLRWSSTQNTLTLLQAEKYTKNWLKNSQSTSRIYNQFSRYDSCQKPQIVLKKKCKDFSSLSYWKLFFDQSQSPDENYPAYAEDNKIIICLNHITNKTQLKENIDRQLTILCRNTQKSTKKLNQIQNGTNWQNQQIQRIIQEKDKDLIQNLYEGCRQGYRNYLLEKNIEQRVSKKCAKYLFFRRCERKLPWDAKFRYATKIVEEVL